MKQRIVCFILSLCMVLTMIPVSAFAEEATGFNQLKRVGDVIVDVSAPAGVFPKDAELSVTLVEDDSEEAEAIGDAVGEVRDEDKNITSVYTFDIKVLDADGSELTPDTSRGNVAVIFKMAEAENSNLTADVYHVEGTAEEETLSAEALETLTTEDLVVVETDGFSYYVVEFTYSAKEYQMAEGDSVKLSEILKAVQLSGDIQSAASGSEDLTTVEDEDDGSGKTEYTVTAVNAGTVTLSVVLGDDSVTYDITVIIGEGEGSSSIGYKVVNFEEFRLSDMLNAIGLLSFDAEEASQREAALDRLWGAWVDEEGENYLSISENGKDYTCEPCDQGVATVTVLIGDDEASACAYEISVAIGYRDDSEIEPKEKEQEDDPEETDVPKELQGNKQILMPEYTGSVELDLTTDISIRDDISITSKEELGNAINLWLMDLSDTRFTYNGEKVSYFFYNGFNSGVSGLQVVPFVTYVEKGHEMQLTPWVYNGQFVANSKVAEELYYQSGGYYNASYGDDTVNPEIQLYTTALFADSSSYYYDYDEVSFIIKQIGLSEDFDLVGKKTPLELEVVYGYMICDADYNYGYKEIGRSNSFTFTNSYDVPEDNAPNPYDLTFYVNGEAYSYSDWYDSYTYIYTEVGQPVGLTEGYAVEGAEDITFRVQSNYNKAINFDNPSNSAGYVNKETKWNPKTRTYETEYYSYYYYIEVVYKAGTSEEKVIATKDDCYLYIYPERNAFFALNASESSMRVRNYVYAVPEKKWVQAAYDYFDRYSRYYGGSQAYAVFTEDSLLNEMAKHFWLKDADGNAVNVPASWVEFDSSYEMYDLSMEYDCPYEWEEDDISNSKYFYLVFKVGDPDSDAEPETVTVQMYLYREFKEAYIEYYMEDEESGFDESYYYSLYSVGDYISGTEVEKLTTEVNNTDFWLYTFLEGLKGNFSIDQRFTSGTSGESLQYNGYLSSDYGVGYFDVFQRTGISQYGRYDENGLPVLREDELYKDFSVKIIGSLDMNKVGVYNISIVPTINGIADEEFAFNFEVTVREKPEMSVKIKDNSTTSDTKNFDFYKSCINALTADNINNTLMKGISGKTEYDAIAEVSCKIVSSQGQTVSLEELATALRTPDDQASIKEGDILLVTYTAEHPKDASITAKLTKTITIRKTAMDFSGLKDITVTEGKITSVDSILKSGLSVVVATKTVMETVDDKLVEKEYIVSSTVSASLVGNGGFTADAKAGEVFTVTYTAVHPVTGFTYSGTRQVIVSSAKGKSELQVGLTDNSGIPENDVKNFILGGAGQGEISINVSFDPKHTQKDTEISDYVYINFPYGFEVKNPTNLKLGGATAPSEVIGSYKDKAGTTLVYHFTSKVDTVNCDYAMYPHLEILYPALEEGYTQYAVSAQCYDGQVSSSASDLDKMELVFVADPGFDDEMSFTLDGENGTKTYTTTQFFGNDMNCTSDYGPDNGRSNTYTITVNKTAGKLPDSGWNMSVQLPEGLGLSASHYTKNVLDRYPYSLTYYDEDGNVLVANKETGYTTKNGLLTVPLYNSNRFNFSTTNISGTPHTYMDMVRKAAKVELTLYFSINVAADKLTVNLPSAASMAAMKAESKVELNNGAKVLAQSEYPMGIILVNGTDTLDVSHTGTTEMRLNSITGLPSSYHGSVKNSGSEIAAGSVGVHSSLLTIEGGVTSYDIGVARGPWNVYQHPVMTITYPYEYSPVSVYSADLGYYDMVYSVSKANGAAVYGKQNLKVSSSNQVFDLAEGEYVSSVTVSWKGDFQNLVHNWGSYRYFLGSRMYNSIPFPMLSVQAKATDKDGNALPAEGKTVTIATTAYDDKYTVPAIEQSVTIRPIVNQMVISASDRSTDKEANVAVSSNTRWSDGSSTSGMVIYINTTSETLSYTDPVLIITGEALSMVDFTSIYGSYITGDIKIIGYSTSDKVTTAGPWGENNESDLWVQDGSVKALAAENFASLKDAEGNQIPVTGILLDLSELEYAGKIHNNGATSSISMNSVYLWASSPFFDIVKEQILTADRDENGTVDGYASLAYSVGFHCSDTDRDAVVTLSEGHTAKVTAGRVPGSINQRDSSYTLNPFAGGHFYDFSYMELVQVNTVPGGGGEDDNSYGGVNDCTTVFTSDGTEKGDALMSLTEGLSVQGGYSGGYGDPKISKVYYEVINASGVSETREATNRQSHYSGGETLYYHSKASGNGLPTWFYPFTLAKGEYVTKVTVDWGESVSGRTLYPSLGLVRVSALPTTTATGYTLSVGEQLPVTVDMSYSAWTAEDGQLNHLTKTFTSAKMCAAKNKSLTDYSVSLRTLGSDKTESTKPYQGESFYVELSSYFAFSTDSVRLGKNYVDYWNQVANVNGDSNWNSIHHTVYYRIDKNFEYAVNSIDSSKASVTYYPNAFSDGDGLLKVVYNGYYGSWGDIVTGRLRVLFSAKPNESYVPVKAAYLDISYDINNSMAERGYNIVYGGTTVSGIEGLKSSVMTKAGLTATTSLKKATISKAVTPLKSEMIAVNMMPTMVSDDVTLKGDIGGEITSISGSTFGVYCEVLSQLGNVADDVTLSTEDWEIYIPIPRKGVAVENKTPQYDLKLAKAIEGLSDSAVVTYTTDENPSYNKLTGTADTSAYVPASEITDWGKVTAIHISVPQIKKGAPESFTLTFQSVEKVEVGVLTAYCNVLYNYKYSDNYANDMTYGARAGKMGYGAGGVNEGALYGSASPASYTLTDYTVSGTVWDDVNGNGLKDEGEAGMNNVKVEVLDKDGKSVKTAATALVKASAVTGTGGTYTVAMPKPGDYTIKFTALSLPYIESDAEAYDFTATKQSSLYKAWSFASQGSGTVAVTVTENGITAAGVQVETLNNGAANINVGYAKNTISAGDFSYGIDGAELTELIALQLSGAQCTLPVSGGQYSVDHTQLAVITGAAISAAVGKYPLTITYTPYSGATSAVSTTINVFLREKGSDTPTGDVKAEYITAQDFDWAIGSTELTATNAKKMAFVSAIDSNGNAYKLTKIAVNTLAEGEETLTQLEAINEAAMAEGAQAGQKFSLTFTTPGNAAKNVTPASVTVQVTLTDTDAKKGKATGSDYLVAKNLSYARSEYEAGKDIETGKASATAFTAESFIAAAQVSGFDADGYALTNLVVNSSDLGKLNAAFTGRKPGNYSVKISHTNDKGTATTDDDVVTTVKSVVTITDTFVLNLAGNGNTGNTTADVTLTTCSSITLAYGADSLTLPANTYTRSKDGIDYRFTGWATTAKGSGTYADQYTFPRALINSFYGKATDENGDGVYEYTLYAAWERIPGTGKINLTVIPRSPLQGIKDVVISIYSGGVSVKDDITVTMEDGVTINDAFEGLDPASYTVKLSCGYYSTEQTVALAKGETVDLTFSNVGEQSYSVSFNLNGGTNLTGVNNSTVSWKLGTTYKIPTADISDQDSTHPVYWQLVGTDKTYSSGQSVKNLAAADEAIVFKAIWNTNVIFDENGGDDILDATVAYNGTYELPECTRSNYKFLGWKDESGATYPAGFEVSFNGKSSATMAAQWLEDTYTVSFDANGGSCVRSTKSIGKVTDTVYGMLPTPSHPYAKSFDGWFTTTSGGIKIEADTAKPTGDITLYANWTFKTFSITEEGEAKAETATYGTPYTYTVPGYDASKDYTVTMTIGGKTYIPVNNGDGTYTVPGENVTGDIVVSSVESEENYITLTYMFEGRALGTTKVAKNSAYPSVGLPTKTGYTVSGWFDGPDSETLVTGSVAETDPVTVLYARAAINQITVSFVVDGEDYAAPSTENYGDPVVFPADPSKANNNFTGWKGSNGVFIPAGAGYATPAQAVSFTAEWQPVGVLTINVVDNEGEPAAGIPVRLIQGGVVIMTGVSDAQGHAIFTNLVYGAYNAEAVNTLGDATEVTATVALDIDSDSIVKTLVVPIVKLNTKVDSTLNLTADNLENAIPDGDKPTVESISSGSMEVIITMAAKNTSDSDEDPLIKGSDKNIKNAMDAAVENENTETVKKQLIEYVDITMNKETKVNGSTTSSEAVTETYDYQIISIEITQALYEALAAVDGTPENILVYRMHEGKISQLKKVSDVNLYDEECYCIKNVAGVNYVVIKARYFSTYAFGVQNTAVEEDNPIIPVDPNNDDTASAEKRVFTSGVDQWLITDEHVAYISGYTDGTVRPTGNITRAETAMMFYRLLKNKDVDITVTFPDVADNAWYSVAVNTLASLGIISGYNDGSFGPDKQITRAEFTAMAMKFAIVVEGNTSFPDVSEDFWAEAFISSAATYGWIVGFEDGTFRPDAAITRAEAATIINHMLQREADMTYIKINMGKLASFTDLSSDAWYYGDIMEAANLHDYTIVFNKEYWK